MTERVKRVKRACDRAGGGGGNVSERQKQTIEMREWAQGKKKT